MTNSRQKGKRLERLAVAALKLLGFNAERTQQYQGRGSNGDVRVYGTHLHVEVKGRATITAARWMDQAVSDSMPHTIPLVVMREDRGPWLAMCRLHDLPQLAEQHAAGVAHAKLCGEAPCQEG
jgi:hypothetical protein